MIDYMGVRLKLSIFYLIFEIEADKIMDNVTNIAKKFGYNERHLYRLFKTNYGVAPKVLLNILRLHLCLTLILEKNMKLIDIANLCGFYDQSHFIREIKKYTGISPLKIIEDYK